MAQRQIPLDWGKGGDQGRQWLRGERERGERCLAAQSHKLGLRGSKGELIGGQGTPGLWEREPEEEEAWEDA